MAQGRPGQPCDIVAIKKGEAMLCDVKRIQSGRLLRTDRIEPNQRTAFAYASSLGVRCAFACVCDDGRLRFLPWGDIDLSRPSQRLGEAAE